MAVLTAVLTPALLTYVERSRAQKDDSAMGEVTNAIQLALADQEIYDEMLMCAEDGATTLEFINENQSYIINNTKITTADTSVTTADTLGGVKRSGEFATEGTDAGQLAKRLNNLIGTTVSLTSRTHRTDNYIVTIDFGSDANDYAVSVAGDWKTTGSSAGAESGSTASHFDPSTITSCPHCGSGPGCFYNYGTSFSCEDCMWEGYETCNECGERAVMYYFNDDEGCVTHRVCLFCNYTDDVDEDDMYDCPDCGDHTYDGNICSNCGYPFEICPGCGERGYDGAGCMYCDYAPNPFYAHHIIFSDTSFGMNTVCRMTIVTQFPDSLMGVMNNSLDSEFILQLVSASTDQLEWYQGFDGPGPHSGPFSYDSDPTLTINKSYAEHNHFQIIMSGTVSGVQKDAYFDAMNIVSDTVTEIY